MNEWARSLAFLVHSFSLIEGSTSSCIQTLTRIPNSTPTTINNTRQRDMSIDMSWSAKKPQQRNKSIFLLKRALLKYIHTYYRRSKLFTMTTTSTKNTCMPRNTKLRNDTSHTTNSNSTRENLIFKKVYATCLAYKIPGISLHK